MSRPRRVVMLIDSLLAGGAERIAVEVACALDRERYAPWVLVTRHGGPLEENLRRGGVDYTILGRRRGFAPNRLWRAHALVRSCDLIHSHKWSSNMWGSLLSRTSGVPLVAREPTFSGVRTLRRTIGYRYWIAPTARRIICPSAAVAQSLYDEGVAQRRVVVVPNGVQLDAALPRFQARAELGLDDVGFVVGITARLRAEKAHDVLLRAIAKLIEDGRALRLCIIGDGPRRRDLLALADALEIARYVHWAGERSDAKRLASAFDVGVICSDWEGLPVASLEIMAAGVPLVATEVGALPQLLRDGAGLLVPVGDPSRLARAIGDLMDNAELAATIADRGQQRIEADYSFDTMLRRFQQVYDEALANDRTHERRNPPPPR